MRNVSFSGNFRYVLKGWRHSNNPPHPSSRHILPGSPCTSGPSSWTLKPLISLLFDQFLTPATFHKNPNKTQSFQKMPVVFCKLNHYVTICVRSWYAWPSTDLSVNYLKRKRTKLMFPSSIECGLGISSLHKK